jgi:hypothetical protein
MGGNNEHRLECGGRFRATSLLCCLLLLLTAGDPAVWIPLLESLSPSTQEDDRSDLEGGEAAKVAALPAAGRRTTPRRTDSRPRPVARLNVAPLSPPSPGPSAPPATALAKRNGVGIPLRC